MLIIMLRLLITCYCYFMLVSRSVQVAPFQTSIWKPTEQQPCKSGKYATITRRNTTQCRYCSLCPKGQQVKTDCGTHSDTVCEDCPSGSFNDVRGGVCRPCGRCRPGTYVRRYCAVTHDIKCRICPKQRFNTVWNTEACEKCRRCKSHEKFKAKCQKNKDTQCGDCLHGYFRESFTGNCLPCSPCPYYDLRRYVVNECQTRLGIEHSDVCWPGVFTYDQRETRTRSHEIVELDMEGNKLRGLQAPLIKMATVGTFELAVDKNRPLEKEDELFQNTLTLTAVLGVSVTAVVVFMSVVLLVRMRRIRNGIPNITESGSFTYEGDHQQEVNEYSNTVHTNDPEVRRIQVNYMITPETGNTCTHLSDYTLSSTTDQSSTDLTLSTSDVLCKSESAPTVLKSENETGCTDSFTDVPYLVEKKKKSKRRRKRSPPDVVYYTIPCNPQYFPKQMYVTL